MAESACVTLRSKGIAQLGFQLAVIGNNLSVILVNVNVTHVGVTLGIIFQNLLLLDIKVSSGKKAVKRFESLIYADVPFGIGI